MFTLRCLQPDIVPIICHQQCWHWRHICHRCQQYKRNWWQNLPLTSVVHLDLQISPPIKKKNLKWPLCYYQGLGGRWFMKKNLKQNTSWHCPFKTYIEKIETYRIRRTSQKYHAVFPNTLRDIKLCLSQRTFNQTPKNGINAKNHLLLLLSLLNNESFNLILWPSLVEYATHFWLLYCQAEKRVSHAIFPCRRMWTA